MQANLARLGWPQPAYSCRTRQLTLPWCSPEPKDGPVVPCPHPRLAVHTEAGHILVVQVQYAAHVIAHHADLHGHSSDSAVTVDPLPASGPGAAIMLPGLAARVGTLCQLAGCSQGSSRKSRCKSHCTPHARLGTTLPTPPHLRISRYCTSLHVQFHPTCTCWVLALTLRPVGPRLKGTSSPLCARCEGGC